MSKSNKRRYVVILEETGNDPQYRPTEIRRIVESRNGQLTQILKANYENNKLKTMSPVVKCYECSNSNIDESVNYDDNDNDNDNDNVVVKKIDDNLS